MRGAMAGLAAALLLGGCWDSAGPMMPEAARDPSPISGRYTEVPAPAARPAPPATYRAEKLDRKGLSVKVSKRAVVGKDERWNEEATLAFDRLPGAGHYLVESRPARPGRVAWFLLTASGDSVVQIVPACASAQIKQFHATKSGSACAFTSYADVRGAAEALMTEFAANGAVYKISRKSEFRRN